eukprot:scaffold73790_cov15-Tisochrysis_lutea.AAC.1
MPALGWQLLRPWPIGERTLCLHAAGEHGGQHRGDGSGITLWGCVTGMCDLAFQADDALLCRSKYPLGTRHGRSLSPGAALCAYAKMWAPSVKIDQDLHNELSCALVCCSKARGMAAAQALEQRCAPMPGCGTPRVEFMEVDLASLTR